MIAKNGRRGRERKSEGEKKKFFKKPAVEQEPKTLACGKRQVTRTASFTLRTERGGEGERGYIPPSLGQFMRYFCGQRVRE
jgi:hypothetical protein